MFLRKEVKTKTSEYQMFYLNLYFLQFSTLMCHVVLCTCTTGTFLSLMLQHMNFNVVGGEAEAYFNYIIAAILDFEVRLSELEI